MNFSVTILGSSSALPTSDRFLTAQVLNVNERFFLIDCGEGTQIQLRRCKIRFGSINHIFISHLHGDHVFGLPGLLSSFNLLGRKNDLHIYSHKPLKQIINQFLGQFFSIPEFNIVYHIIDEYNTSMIYEDKQVEVFSFPLKHRIPCSGFLFKEKKKLRSIKKDAIEFYNIPISEIIKIKKGWNYIDNQGNIIENSIITVDSSKPRSFAFVTDTEFLPEIIPIISDVDLLYHESTYLSEETDLAKQTGHSTVVEAARMANLAGASKLLLGHFSSRYKDCNLFYQQAKEIFPNVFIAEEGKTIQI